MLWKPIGAAKSFDQAITEILNHSMMVSLKDSFGRPLRSLRVSVTDRCNLRCLYCMPREEYVWLPREDLLTFEEITELVGIFTELGVEKVRLTGGEPLLRKDLSVLIGMVSRNPRLTDLAMTTNGVQLAAQAHALRDAGLRRLTISLDTLRRDRFQRMTRRDALDDVLAGIRAATEVGFTGAKIDAVVIRGQNEDELLDLLDFGRQAGVEVRFLEYMDVGGATHWSMSQVFTREEILDAIERRFGRIRPIGHERSAPAERFELSDGTVFGIIASTTSPFCATCDRSRLTADGMWYLCLYATHGVNLRELMRKGASHAEIKERIASAWTRRADRGAEERKRAHHREAFLPVEVLRADPHLEMHTRGG